MSTVTENNLKELKDLIIAFREDTNKRLTVIESKIDRLFEEVNGLKIEIAIVKTDVKGIDKRLDEFNSRFNIMTVGFLSIIGVLVTGVLSAIAKLVFSPIRKFDSEYMNLDIVNS